MLRPTLGLGILGQKYLDIWRNRDCFFREPAQEFDDCLDCQTSVQERFLVDIRPIALNRKNALFAGHDAGAENWATIASLIETCKLNSVDPLVYLTATLTAIVGGHKQSQINELLPWNYKRK